MIVALRASLEAVFRRRDGNHLCVSPFELDRRDVAQRRVPTLRDVPALNELEYDRASLSLRVKPMLREQLALQCREERLALALSKQSPTEPIDGHTPASRQRDPNAIDVYRVDSSGRRNSHR